MNWGPKLSTVIHIQPTGVIGLTVGVAPRRAAIHTLGVDPQPEQTLSVDIWSDIACPWCHVGKRHLEAAIAQFEHRQSIRIVWHAFELDPGAAAVLPEAPSYAERLAKKYGVGLEQGQAMIDRMTQTAALDDLDFRFDIIRPGNTFDAHRLLHLAATHDGPEGGKVGQSVQDALKERLFVAYLTEGQAIGDRATLARLADEVGLDADEVAGVLGSDQFATEVRADQSAARALGVSGVPFFVIAGRVGVSGAQPVEVMLQALHAGWKHVNETLTMVHAEGAACGPAGCD